MAVIRETPVSVREEQGAIAAPQKRSLWPRLFSGKARPIRFFLVGQTATLTQLCVLYALTSLGWLPGVAADLLIWTVSGIASVSCHDRPRRWRSDAMACCRAARPTRQVNRSGQRPGQQHGNSRPAEQDHQAGAHLGPDHRGG